MTRRRSILLLAICAVVSACGSSAPAGGSSVGRFAAGVWTWVDVPGTACSDGSTTGFAVNPGTGPDLAFFLDGGGACWDYTTCFLLHSAAAGPVHAAEFEAHSQQFAGTFLDRNAPSNPFAGWTFVYVPYCTGDLHAGDAQQTYVGPGGLTGTWSHRGRVNVAADLAVIVPALPRPQRLVVTGSSAGGFGSLLQYDVVRQAFGADETFLVDDSGPPLEGDALNPSFRSAWRSSWNLDPLLATVCPDCADDFSRIVPELVARHPQDRVALLSSIQDQVIRTYFLLPPEVFEAALLLTVHDRFDPLPSARTFLVQGQDHALFAQPSAYTAGGVSLTTWLTQMMSGDPAWRSEGP